MPGKLYLTTFETLREVVFSKIAYDYGPRAIHQGAGFGLLRSFDGRALGSPTKDFNGNAEVNRLSE